MRSVIAISFLLAIIYQNVNASPIFFSNPFATGRIVNDDQENVSVYTTAEPSMEDDQMPSIYLQIIRNIYERVAAPFNFGNSADDDAEKSSKIVSTTRTSVEKMLEIVEEPTEEDSNSTEVYEKEEVDPSLIEKNPSFNNRIRNEDSRPERIVLYPGLRAFREEDDQLENKELSESTENDISEESDSDSDDSESEEDEEIEPNTVQPNGRFSEYAAIYLLESLASAITLAWGAFNAIFQSRSVEN